MNHGQIKMLGKNHGAPLYYCRGHFVLGIFIQFHPISFVEKYCALPTLGQGTWSNNLVKIGESTTFTCDTGYGYNNGTKIMTSGTVQCRLDETVDYKPSCTSR